MDILVPEAQWGVSRLAAAFADLHIKSRTRRPRQSTWYSLPVSSCACVRLHGSKRRYISGPTRADLQIRSIDPMDRVSLSLWYLPRHIDLAANGCALRQLGRGAIHSGISRRALSVGRPAHFGCCILTNTAVLSGRPASCRSCHV